MKKNVIENIVNSLRHTMIMENPSTDTLENWIEKRLGMLNTQAEKLELLTEVFKLKNVRELDVYYLGKIQSFFQYIDHRIQSLTPDKTEKVFPPLPKCFVDEEYFWNLLKHPIIEELYTKLEDGTYIWKKNKKKHLAALAHRLKDRKLNKDIIKTSQDLAKVFCPFFNVKYDAKGDKTFAPVSNTINIFDFIK